MGKVRSTAKPVSWFLAILMMVIFTPHQVVMAKMVTAERLLDAGRANDARAYVGSILAREDVKAALIAQGIDANEAVLRISALSDAEVIDLADHMERLPAGSGGFETFLIVGLIVFLVLLFTDISGATDIFPFVKKNR